jgi:hypothetical protein
MVTLVLAESLGKGLGESEKLTIQEGDRRRQMGVMSASGIWNQVKAYKFTSLTPDCWFRRQVGHIYHRIKHRLEIGELLAAALFVRQY